FQNAVLQCECRYVFYTSRVEATCNIVVVIVDAYDEVRLRGDHLQWIPLLVVVKICLTAQRLFSRHHVCELIPQQTPDFPVHFQLTQLGGRFLRISMPRNGWLWRGPAARAQAAMRS